MWTFREQRLIGGWILLGILLMGFGALSPLVSSQDKDYNFFNEKLPNWTARHGERIVIARDWIFESPEELLDPWANEPQWDQMLTHHSELEAIEQCFEFPPMEKVEQVISIEKWSKEKANYHRLQYQKLKWEFELKCKEADRSSSDLFWQTAPFIHPLGGSWAARLGVEDVSFQTVSERYPIFANPLKVRAFLQDHLMIPLEKSFLFHQQGQIGGTVYRQVNIKDLQEFLKSQGFALNTNSEWSCRNDRWTECFVPVHGLLAQLTVFSLPVGLFIVASGLLVLALFYRRKQIITSEYQKISALAISHELRHPVAVMRLVLDRWRSRFDEIPADFQDDFFRLSSELRRLNLLAQASETFLRSVEGERPQWQIQRLGCIASWGQHLAESHGVEFSNEVKEGIQFSTDPYWLGVAIENLIKNAKKHGQPPVVLKMRIDINKLTVEVQDSGEGFFESSTSSGLGLGLQITQKIVKSMGGSKILFLTQPKRVQFYVKELKDEKDLSRRG